MVVRAHGHPAIRATHDATLEVTRSAVITTRATCVIGVGAEVLAEPALPVAGPVTIDASVAGERFVAHAFACPQLGSDAGWVIRRSGNRLPGTLATDCTHAANGVPRTMVARLANPGAVLELVIRPGPVAGVIPATVVLVSVEPGRPLSAVSSGWISHAQLVCGVDDDGRRAIRQALPPTMAPPSLEVDRLPDQLPNGWADGGLMLVLVGRPTSLATAARDVAGSVSPANTLRWETDGLGPAAAVGSLIAADQALLVLPEAPSAEVAKRLLAASTSSHSVVGALPSRRAAAVLDTVGQADPDAMAAVMLRWRTPAHRLLRGQAAQLTAELASSAATSRDEVLVALAGGTAEDRRADGGVPHDAVVLRSLHHDGVSHRSLVQAWSRRPGARRNEVDRALREMVDGAPMGEEQ